jgi:MFS family permease
LIGWGTLYFPFALMIAPMEAEFGWSRAEIFTGLTIGLCVTGVGAVPVGRWVDRHGGRLPMVGGAGLGVVALVGWAMVDSLLAFYLMWVLMGAALVATQADPAYAVLTRTLTNYRRGVTLVSFVTGCCTFLFIPLTQYLIGTIGWRGALLALAGLQVLAILFNHLALLPLKGWRPLPAGNAATPLRQVWRRPLFWALCLAFGAQILVSSGLTFHFLPLLVERGIDVAVAAWVLALTGPTQVAARMALAWGGERITMRQLGRLALGAVIIGIVLLLLLPLTGIAGALLYVLCYGVSQGLITIVRAVGMADFFGREGYGAIAGLMTALMVVPRTVSPLLIAAIWTLSGGYTAVLLFALAVSIAGATAFFLAVKPLLPPGRGRPAGSA